MKIHKFVLLSLVALGGLIGPSTFADEGGVNSPKSVGEIALKSDNQQDESITINTTYSSSDGKQLKEPTHKVIAVGEKLDYGYIYDITGYTLNLDKTMARIGGQEGSLSDFVNNSGMSAQEIVDYLNSVVWPGGSVMYPEYINYVYDKNIIKGGDVTVKYQDNNGNSIADDTILTGNVGDPYSSEQLNIDGYTFKETNGVTTGTFDENSKTIVYTYTKNAIVNPNQPSTTEPGLNTNNGAAVSTESKMSKTPISDVAVETKTVNHASLPATGENKTSIISLIGLILAGFGTAGAFIFGRNK